MEPNSNGLHILVKNVGGGIARDISFKVKDENDFRFIVLHRAGGGVDSIKNQHVIKEGLRTLAPDQEKTIAFIDLANANTPGKKGGTAELFNKPIEMTLMYRDVRNIWFPPELCVLDFPYYFDLWRKITGTLYDPDPR
jgi:hypothetical protein